MYAVVCQVLNIVGMDNIEAVPTLHAFYKDCLTLHINQKSYVHMGQVTSSILRHTDIEPPVFFAEVDIMSLLQNKPKKQPYNPIAKFPAVLRDRSLAIEESVTFAQIYQLIKKQAIEQLQAVYMIDYYVGNNLDSSKKAYTLRFVLQDVKKTLREQEIYKIMQQFIQVLQTELSATIRG